MFGLFKKKPVTPPVEEVASALGWDAIEAAFDKRYPSQKPRHWAHGGVMRMHDMNNPPENPLDGVSIYDGEDHWHYVSFGMSDLYTQESEDAWSGFGYEFTFRLAKDAQDDPPLWPIDVMVSLARAQYQGSEFGPGQTIKTGPIDGDENTALDALLLVEDPGFELLETPHGKLVLLQLVGIENAVRERALESGVDGVIEAIKTANPDFVTRL